MKKNLLLFVLSCLTTAQCIAQSAPDTTGKAKKDSITHAKMIADSLKMEKLLAIEQFPLIKGGKWSGIIPVSQPTEIPDSKQNYKLLFELSAKNPDSLAKEINHSLDEVARILNLHVASGIPADKLFPVILIHGPGIEAVINNNEYKKRHSIDNPNLKIIHDLENIGAKLIVCGQAMAFLEFKKEDLLSEIKISLTAKTVLSNYQLQGYVLYTIDPDK